MALTPKQQRFVEEYAVDLNATAAYQRAGYKARSGPSAENAASRLLGNVGVRRAVDELLKKASERSQVSAEWVIERLRIEALREDEDATHGARVKALELLGKHHRLFVDVLHVEADVRQRVVEEVVDADDH